MKKWVDEKKKKQEKKLKKEKKRKGRTWWLLGKGIKKNLLFNKEI